MHFKIKYHFCSCGASLIWKARSKKTKQNPTNNPECICATDHSLSKFSHSQFPVFLSPSPTSQALPTHLFLGTWSLPSTLLFHSISSSWPNPGIWVPFLTPFCPSLLIMCFLLTIPAGTGSVKSLHPLPGLFQWLLNWSPCWQSLLMAIKPIPATVVFLEIFGPCHFPAYVPSRPPSGGLWAGPTGWSPIGHPWSSPKQARSLSLCAFTHASPLFWNDLPLFIGSQTPIFQ